MKWDGMRVLADARDGQLTLTSRSGRDVTAAYPELPIPPLPYWSAPPRGGSPVIIRCDGIDGAMLEWATATDDAFASLGQVLDLERGGDW